MALVSFQVTSGETGPAGVIDCAHRSLLVSGPSFLAIHEISKTDQSTGWMAFNALCSAERRPRRADGGRRMTVQDAQSGGQKSSSPLQGAVLGAEAWGGVLRKGS
jgi:hypothetical protein